MAITLVLGGARSGKSRHAEQLAHASGLPVTVLATAEAQDDESEEDLLVVSREFDLRSLIEDELLMAMPLVPLHDVCPSPIKMAVVDPDFEEAVAAKPNPFAALAALQKKP